jgi:hypothetical protein
MVAEILQHPSILLKQFTPLNGYQRLKLTEMAIARAKIDE